ncbi:MAG: 50S ribosomal protein L11 methyltransferase [Bacteroidales bacterium]|nr:50S ribosomal protein L11 methyltransferase [Bacteroidales bacterium]
MIYLEFNFQFDKNEEIAADILAAELAETGFESFERNDKNLLAYVRENNFQEADFKNKLKNFPLEDINISYTQTQINETDWNQEWEKNYFQPIIIDDKCIIRSSFHKIEKPAQFEIIIDPKMAFGTGHHETTHLMLNELLTLPLENKTLLDMGCGTAVLAILASMRGARDITAIDIDEWAYENAKENITLNKIINIDVELGDAERLTGKRFDYILANINRNILLADMQTYVNAMQTNASLFVSGFYTEDIPALKEKAQSLGLTYEYSKERNHWALIKFRKDQ